jgi:hypothetical protein
MGRIVANASLFDNLFFDAGVSAHLYRRMLDIKALKQRSLRLDPHFHVCSTLTNSGHPEKDDSLKTSQGKRIK